MIITEKQGKAQVFTLKDGSTLRILSRQTKEVKESNISNEIRIAERMGLILLDAPAPKAVVTKAVTKEEDTSKATNKNSGGKNNG